MSAVDDTGEPATFAAHGKAGGASRTAPLLPIAVNMAARLFTIAALASTAVVAQASAGAEGLGRPLYAVTQTAAGGRLLTQLNPATLSPVGPPASLGGFAEPAAFSRDGSLLAVVEWGDRPSVRILELSRMRWQPPVSLNLTTGTVLVRWLAARRLLVLAEQPDGLRALVLDAKTNRLVHATRLPGHLTDRQHVDVGRTRAAVLLRAQQTLGAARVAVISSSGSARIVTLEPIREGADGRHIYRPSLVADPSAERAFVVGAIDEPVAAIDLRTLAVSYRRPFRSANAGGFTGAERMTVWLGHGRFAVAGWDDVPDAESRLLGLRLVDTGSWRARVLDPESDFVCVAGHSLVAHHLDGALVVIGFDGTRRLALRLPGGGPPLHSVSNDRYLYLPDGDAAVVADLAARRVIGRRPLEGVQELLSPTYTLGAGCR